MKGHDIDNHWFFGIVVAVAIPLILVSVSDAKKRARELTELAQQNWFPISREQIEHAPFRAQHFSDSQERCFHQRLNWIGWRIPGQPVRRYLPHGKPPSLK